MPRNTDKDWSKIAEEDPYWGVLSEEQFRGKELSPENKTRFYASGQKYIDDVIGFVRRHIAPEFKVRRGLDFGCGVGRLLIPLAQVSDEAVGVDVAPQMLELTRQNLEQAAILNAVAVASDDSLSLVTGTFNFVNSYIVLQHIPPERGTRIISNILTKLEIGGVFSLQFTYAKERRFFSHEQASARYYRRTGNVIQDLLPIEDRHPEGMITMFDYDLNEVMLVATSISGDPLLALPTNHDGHLGMHLIGLKVRR